jgi:hypothetical protein
VWCKKDRIDLVFGTGAAVAADAEAIPSLVPAVSADNEAVSVLGDSTNINRAPNDVVESREYLATDNMPNSEEENQCLYNDESEYNEQSGGHSDESINWDGDYTSEGDGSNGYILDYDDDDDDFTEGDWSDQMNNENSSRSARKLGDGMKIEDVIATYEDWLLQYKAAQKQLTERNQVIFCDLDGVLADFDAGVRTLFKKKPAEVSPKVLWPRLGATVGFYSSLPWTEGRCFCSITCGFI